MKLSVICSENKEQYLSLSDVYPVLQQNRSKIMGVLHEHGK